MVGQVSLAVPAKAQFASSATTGACPHYLPTYLSVYLSTCPCVRLSVCLSVYTDRQPIYHL